MTIDLAAARAESDQTRRRRRRSVATGLLLTTLVLAGSACGDNEAEGSPQSSPATTTPSTVSAGVVDLATTSTTATTPTTTTHMSHAAHSTATTTVTAAPASAPTSTPVAIADFAFAPTPVRIRPGGTVVWTNQDATVHSIQDKSDMGTPVSPDLAQGDTFSITYPKAGVYPYICGIHISMEGSVEVAG